MSVFEPASMMVKCDPRHGDSVDLLGRFGGLERRGKFGTCRFFWVPSGWYNDWWVLNKINIYIYIYRVCSYIWSVSGLSVNIPCMEHLHVLHIFLPSFTSLWINSIFSVDQVTYLVAHPT